jgi:hypothetical protein
MLLSSPQVIEKKTWRDSNPRPTVWECVCSISLSGGFAVLHSRPSEFIARKPLPVFLNDRNHNVGGKSVAGRANPVPPPSISSGSNRLASVTDARTLVFAANGLRFPSRIDRRRISCRRQVQELAIRGCSRRAFRPPCLDLSEAFSELLTKVALPTVSFRSQLLGQASVSE